MTRALEEYPVSLRWRDLDHQGHVYHATFLELLDEARTQFLRDLGVANPDSYVLVRIEIEFTNQLKIEDPPVVASFAIERVGNSSLTLREKLRTDRNEVSTSHSTIVLWDGREGRSRRLSADELDRAQAHLLTALKDMHA